MNEELNQLDATIFEHLQRRRSLAREAQDVFTPLGNAASLFRTVFAGVEPPIKNLDELIEKAGGRNRLITVSDPRYGELTFALLDILDVVRDLEGYFPIASFEAFVKEVQQRISKSKTKRTVAWHPGLALFPGWGLVPTKNLLRILEEAKAPPTLPTALPPRPVRRPPVPPPCINSDLLTKLAKEFKARAKKAKGESGGNPGIGSASFAFIEEIIVVWVGYIIETCQSEAQARRVEAANARQQAESQANIAQSKRNDAYAATTVGNVCYYATEARAAANAAEAAADDAEDAAILALFAANNCPGNTQAASASSQAQQDATAARAAALNADAAADQAEALCNNCNSIPTITINVHVVDDDSCSGQDDVSGANITVQNTSHPNCPETTRGCSTGSNGRCSVTGRFGNSTVIVTVSYKGYNATRTLNTANATWSEKITVPGLDV